MAAFDEISAGIIALRQRKDAPIETYPVEPSQIHQAEAMLARPIPKVLKVLWLKVGYGFFRGPICGKAEIEAVSCLMNPLDLAEVARSRGWAGQPDALLPFFNEDDEDFLVLVPKDGGFVVEHELAPGTVLAHDLECFITRLCDNPVFWVEMLPD